PGAPALGGLLGHAVGHALAPPVRAQLARIAPAPARVVAGRFGRDGVLRGALDLAAREAREAAWGLPPHLGPTRSALRDIPSLCDELLPTSRRAATLGRATK